MTRHGFTEAARAFLADDDGGIVLGEYALIIVFLVLGLVVAMVLLNNKMKDAMNTVGNKVQNCVGGAPTNTTC